MLRWIIDRLSAAWPNVWIVVRLDGGSASPELFDFFEEQETLGYVVGFANNAVQQRMVHE